MSNREYLIAFCFNGGDFFRDELIKASSKREAIREFYQNRSCNLYAILNIIDLGEVESD